ncbi:MAG: hypothetical protein ACM3S5_03025 [Rhodospirillales bacterium]
METVQLTIADVHYAKALRDLLMRGGNREIRCVEQPDTNQGGVIVVDSEALSRLPLPLVHPERVVLITSNDPKHLTQAWNAGIRSVVFNKDPLSTAVLAIMAAELRVPKTETRWAEAQGLAAAPACGKPAEPMPDGHAHPLKVQRRG